jgi:hypothetical protein
MRSEYFNKAAIRGINKIGDILIPGSDDFPSFSKYGCIEHVDDLLNYAMEDDVKSLNMVLTILGLLPNFMLKALIKWMANAHKNNGPIGDLLRQLNMGLRGIVFALYYSDKGGANYVGPVPTEMIGFDLRKAMN